MTSKERVQRALASCIPDRVPINYMANAGIDRWLKEHFGLRPDDTEWLLQALNVDFRAVDAPYRGPKLHEDIRERGVKVDDWGIHRCWVEHETGGYWDYCDFPLRDVTEEEILQWPMPSPDDFDYSGVSDYCEKNREYAIYLNVYFRLVEPEKRWSNFRDKHELYCAGHLIEAVVAHYEATGKRTLLDALCRYGGNQFRSPQGLSQTTSAVEEGRPYLAATPHACWPRRARMTLTQKGVQKGARNLTRIVKIGQIVARSGKMGLFAGTRKKEAVSL